MLKIIATFAAFATLAATAIAPAHALVIMNGGGSNGFQPNGFQPNGITRNGGGDNGFQPNGIVRNGGGNNGTTADSSTLTIQAIELPPETR